jgi:hypothetical protein
MKGILTPTQQLAVLRKIWGPDRDGYVFLPWINGKATSKEERKRGYHEGPAFEWPTDQEKILAHLSAHPTDDVYFAPCLFLDKRRVEQAAELERALWADLDPVDPEHIQLNLRPTIAWESSPGRYQAVWLLSHPLEGASWAARENHRLTTHLGADISGWDTTQLLRVPGRANHKPEYREANGGRPVPGALLWDNGPRYTPDDIREPGLLPELNLGIASDDADEEVVQGIDRHDVWARVRLKVSVRVREYMAIRRETDIKRDEGVDRSDVIWEISRDLADAGCNVAEIIAVIRPTIWNKFKGRADEFKHLKNGAIKAIAARKAKDETGGGALEAIDEIEKPTARWLTDVMSVRMRRPAWLIHNVWSRGGCGFIAGDPKSYKSWTGLDFAVSVATGTSFLNDPSFRVVGGPQPVIYIQEEDPEVVVRDRIETVLEGKAPQAHWSGSLVPDGAGGMWWNPPTMEQIPLLFFVRAGFVASDPGWQAWLVEMAREVNAASVIIDTLGTTAGDVDTDRAQDLMTKILRPMRHVSNETGAAICVVHHNRKGTTNNDRAGTKMLGSVALHAWVDDAMYIHTREQRKGVTHVKVERESKAAMEHRWTMEIPRMGLTGPWGERQVWSPITGSWDIAPDDTGTGTEVVSTPRKGAPAGARITAKLKTMNAHNRAVPFDRIVEVCGVAASAVRQQLQAAVTSGQVIGDEEIGYRLA